GAEQGVEDGPWSAAVKEMGGRPPAFRPLKDVGLVALPPRQRPPLGAQLIAQPRELLLARQMRLAGFEPLLSRHDGVIRHRRLLDQAHSLTSGGPRAPAGFRWCSCAPAGCGPRWRWPRRGP